MSIKVIAEKSSQNCEILWTFLQFHSRRQLHNPWSCHSQLEVFHINITVCDHSQQMKLSLVNKYNQLCWFWQIPYQCNNEWFEHRFKFDLVKMTDGHHAKTQCFIISKLWHKEGLKVWISNMHQTLLKMRITWLELNPNKHNKFDTQPSVRRLQMEVWPFLLLGLHPQTWFEEKLIGNLKVFPEFWMESNGKWLK